MEIKYSANDLSKIIEDLTMQESSEVIKMYELSREKFTKEQGICLNAPSYTKHWNKREDYALTMAQKQANIYKAHQGVKG